METRVDPKEYAKQYYASHRRAMIDRMKELFPLKMRRTVIKKLNDKSYKRTPFSKIEKYNITFNDESQKYE